MCWKPGAEGIHAEVNKEKRVGQGFGMRGGSSNMINTVSNCFKPFEKGFTRSRRGDLVKKKSIPANKNTTPPQKKTSQAVFPEGESKAVCSRASTVRQLDGTSTLRRLKGKSSRKPL